MGHEVVVAHIERGDILDVIRYAVVIDVEVSRRSILARGERLGKVEGYARWLTGAYRLNGGRVTLEAVILIVGACSGVNVAIRLGCVVGCNDVDHIARWTLE